MHFIETGNRFLSLFNSELQWKTSVASVYSLVIFDKAQKTTIDLVPDVFSCLKYDSYFHKMHLKEPGNIFSLFYL